MKWDNERCYSCTHRCFTIPSINWEERLRLDSMEVLPCECPCSCHYSLEGLKKNSASKCNGACRKLDYSSFNNTLAGQYIALCHGNLGKQRHKLP